ncbi:MAG TPA: hypothetical protein VFM01_00055, partial [Nakamurella sp.]|nr:hypothetical protein [Nakamurella sp.]
MPADGAAPAAPLPVELRVLTGPNLYFPGPAVKLTLDARPALDADAGDVLAWRRALRMLGTSVGLPGSASRHAAAAQIAATVVRRSAARIHRRVPAVGEVGDGGTVIAAFPFRRRGTAEALGAVVARTFADITDGTVSPQRALQRVGSAMAGHDPGEEVAPLRPRIPVIAVTGTNGKTTTTRLIAHLMAAD